MVCSKTKLTEQKMNAPFLPRVLLQGLELLDRPGELVGASLELGEQPRVLDGDGGLVGEGLHQGDLTVGEGPDLESIDGDHPD